MSTPRLADVLDKAGARFGSLLIAYAWIRSQPLPGFSSSTAKARIQEGRADDVLEYLDALTQAYSLEACNPPK